MAGGLSILAAIIVLIRYSQSRTEALKHEFETPVLIQMAFDSFQITNEQRLLYLAYALYEPESLPVRFQSRVGWFGEMAQYELEVLYEPPVFCSMSPHARSKFQRLLRIDITCERNILLPLLGAFLALAIILLVFHARKQKSQIVNT